MVKASRRTIASSLQSSTNPEDSVQQRTTSIHRILQENVAVSTKTETQLLKASQIMEHSIRSSDRESMPLPSSTTASSWALRVLTFLLEQRSCLKHHPPMEHTLKFPFYWPVMEKQNDNFGSSADIQGEWIVIGAYGRNQSAGSVYVFRILDNNNERSSSSAMIQELAIQTAATSAERYRYFRCNYFGGAVAIDDDGHQILVGARGATGNHGTAYLLIKDEASDDMGMQWTQVMQFQPPDHVFTTTDDNYGNTVHQFGSVVALQ